MAKEAALEITDESDGSPVRHGGDVRVRGTIRAGRTTVQVGGDLTVDGDVEAVQLLTGGALCVAGGLSGGPAGRYTVGGKLQCAFVRAAKIMARRDLFVRGDVSDSHVTCAGHVELPDGALYGGDVAANGGITCRTLGRPDGATTVIEAGVGRTLRLLTVSITAQIEQRRQRAEIMRASIEPLMQQMKSLSPQQREKVTEMLFEAGELDDETTKLAAAFQERERQTREQARPRIAVSERAYPGVVIRMDSGEAVLTEPIDGPLTFTCRKTAGVMEIVVIRTADGSVRILPTRPSHAAAA